MSKIFFLAFLAAGTLLFFSQLKYSEPDKENVHHHAGFQVYKNGTLANYSSLEYMKVNPCGEIHKELSLAEEQLEKAHLHDLIGDVVHVHREGATWGDLFKNIKQELTISKAYINGQEVENFLERTINPYESAVIFEGDITELNIKLAEAVTKAHIEETEKRSENCGDNE